MSLEFARSVILKQEVRLTVVGDEDVDVTVIVVVTANHSHARLSDCVDSRCAAHIRKGSVSIVPIKRIRLEFVVSRIAVNWIPLFCSRHMVVIGELDVVCDV